MSEVSNTEYPGLPDAAALITALERVLGNGARIVEREPNWNAHGSPGEIVQCRAGDGRLVNLLCKYESHVGGAWSDVAYEARVYRDILEPLNAGTPRLYGMYREPLSGSTWLILEYIDEAMGLDEVAETGAAVLTAEWLGRFHSKAKDRLDKAPAPFLKDYGEAHYISAAEELASKHPALSPITTGFERITKSLFAGGETIVHGDFHLANILVRDESIFPIDWEMTGTSAGEIDLAALVDGWPEVAEACEKAYADVRWPEGESGDLDLRLGAAQVCLYVEKLSRSVEPAQGDLEGLWAAAARAHLL
jgi:Phosphotransferase enzyme family